jgi:hypothetical protein
MGTRGRVNPRSQMYVVSGFSRTGQGPPEKADTTYGWI